MARLTIHTPDTAPKRSKPYVERVVANNGYLPNLVGALANAPAALETYLTVAEINSRSSLSLAEREVVQIVAATTHGCDFCVAGHSAIALKKAGFEKTAVHALQHGRETGIARLDVLADFTRDVIARRGAVSDRELEVFVAAGFEAEQALDVILGVSLATLCNFANSFSRNDINAQLEAFRPGVLQP